MLRRAGVAVTIDPVVRQAVPAILLSDPALALIRDVFGDSSLFTDRPRITHRRVSWGGSGLALVPQGGVLISEADMAAALPLPSGTTQRAHPDFTLHMAPPFPSGETHRFGARAATAVAVTVNAPEAASWVEAVDDGWLFLIGGGDGPAWLLAVGAPLALLLGQSRHVAPLCHAVQTESATFDTCPRILPALAGDGWLAGGTAALAFDPICGDGTAQAVREAILASAVLVAIAQGGDPQALRHHYDSMLLAAMRRHLALCIPFYQSGGTGIWWQAQVTALTQGHQWCTARLAHTPEPQYVLRGFALVSREAVA
ncbi:hypothetical protein [Sphingobium algorifonticola]|uniref:hypothetical protein n=1 Tax=Sphingobium algorifonticola TaxID=2008318 RepID=UPI001F494650|nr:hypothetical protein [Sphingobium algorifonticola]